MDAGLAGLLSGALAAPRRRSNAPPGAGKRSDAQERLWSTSGGSSCARRSSRSTPTRRLILAREPSDSFPTGMRAARPRTPPPQRRRRRGEAAPTAKGGRDACLPGSSWRARRSVARRPVNLFLGRRRRRRSPRREAARLTNSPGRRPVAASLRPRRRRRQRLGLAGVVDAPQTIQMAANGDSSLGLASCNPALISASTTPREAKPGVRSGARRRAPPRKRPRRPGPARRGLRGRHRGRGVDAERDARPKSGRLRARQRTQSAAVPTHPPAARRPLSALALRLASSTSGSIPS